MKLINITETLEDIMADVVGQSPELVQLKDWNQLARMIQGRLDDRGLYIASRPEHPVLTGRIRPNDMVVAIAHGHRQAIVRSDASSLSLMPFSVLEQAMPDLWNDLFEQALNDLSKQEKPT